MTKRIVFYVCLVIFSRVDLIYSNELEQQRSNSFEISTCCSTTGNDQLFISCSSNEIIQLNLIEIFYNSNVDCSIGSSCCQTKTSCSRRLTKYYHSNCHHKQFCFIDKTCFKIYSSCAHPNGLHGQFIYVQYSCLTLNSNQTQQEEEEDEDEELSPIIVKLSTSDQTTRERTNLVLKSELKSSPIYLLLVIFIFIVLMFVIYSLADFVGKRFCRDEERKSLSSHLIYLNKTNEKVNVQSTIPKTRIYPKEIHSYYPYQTLINVQHDPTTGQVVSTTFYPHFQYYHQ